MIDAAVFRRENLEASFWATVQEAIGEPGLAAARNEEDRCGTLYLQNIEGIEESFRNSIIEFFKEKKEKLDREVVVVIGLYGRERLPAAPIKNYDLIEVPPLRRRKEDLPQLISWTLADLSAAHNKRIKAVSNELLSLLCRYDWPGNYSELQCRLAEAVLASSSEILGLKDLPLDFKMLLEIAFKKASLTGGWSLIAARRWFEKFAGKTLLAKNGQDIPAAARFLDCPKAAFLERSAELGSDLLN